MIQTRIIGKLLRGKATPFQIASACVLGGLIGAQPGFMSAPGIVVTLIALLLVLNANLFFAGLIAGLTKLASLALVAVQFELGMLLVDGPLQGLFRGAVNAPVLAWFGFDNYVAVGGLAFGAIAGLVAAVFVLKAVSAFRRKMADLEDGSDRYKKWASKGWVKFLSWLLIGGNKGKKSYRELAEKKALPIRIPGVILAAVLLGAVAAVPFVLTDGVVTQTLRTRLGQANGATVDLESASVDLGAGSAVLTGLAVADRSDLMRNVVEASTVNADFSTTDLLRKRVTIDLAVLEDVRQDTERTTRAELIGKPDKPAPTPPPADDNEGQLEKYLKQAEEWKDRLRQAKDWIEEQQPRDDDPSDPGADPGADPDATPGAGPRESLRDRLRRRARELGYANVTADHLLEGYPRALVKELRVQGLLAGERRLNVKATNLSTDPHLAPEPAAVDVVSADRRIIVRVRMPKTSADPTRLVAKAVSLNADTIAAQIVSDGPQPFSGGTLDIEFVGAMRGGAVNAPLNATLRNSTIDLPQVGPTLVEELTIPVRVSGPLDNPTIRIDPKDLSDALAAAGQAEAARRIGAEADKLADKALDAAGDAVDDETKDKVKGALRGLLGGGDDDDKP
jgi:uncharacterized protein (TIGR03546 family)